ncbi:hypothetical protein NA57DRAFT_74915 [Rhizodiscina lignyota]|uniref:Peroxin/Ferlin domain-containing protein n=1 Tax=Rhizodiscina lignyota TaxID=1504668 RepID=A0A9P4M6Y6_9PEZI|nr:hypothetical protein NA57DRAFT_74915 [Rhizodiscina lignyota]
MSILTQNLSLFHTDTANPGDTYDHEIQLVDHTKPRVEEGGTELSQAPTAQPEPETPISPTESATSPLSQKWTRGSLHAELTKRKYRKWQEERVVEAASPTKPSTVNVEEEPSASPADSQPETPQHLPSKRDTFRTTRHAVKDSIKDAIRGPRSKHVHTHAASTYDVLYENQRGMFCFGNPRFSSNSLLNFDPPAWQTATSHPSPVDITNAQLPDPSWVWAEGWKSWYVDMSGDVDEEGWRYSFAFGQRGRFSWHGTHPWFHSFVRRRRWVRLRVRKGHPLSGEKAPKTMHEAHMLTAEYFTIHNAERGPSPDRDSYTVDTKRQSVATSKRWSAVGGEDEPPIEEVEIRDISTLLKRLRKAPIDREKVTDVRTFLEQGGEELFYLAESMHEMMSLLVFQSSRQQLLTMLLKKYEDATEEQKKENRKKKKEKEKEISAGDQSMIEKNVENLRRAVEAANEECKRLEYWSDMRDVVRDGEVNDAADEPEGWDKSGADSRDAMSPCDSDDEGDNKSPVGKTTIFADDVDDGKGEGERFDGSYVDYIARKNADTPKVSHEDETPSAEEVKSPDEEHPYDPAVADEHHEPGEGSGGQGMPDSGDGVD